MAVPLQTLCFSHLRWKFVYQRPQHLMTRLAHHGLVHLWEEPIFETREDPRLAIDRSVEGVTVITPLLPLGCDARTILNMQRALLEEYIQQARLAHFIAWYYTPMALQFTGHLRPTATVYDCMDELSAFQGAPPELVEYERRLFARADVVFAGGASLYASKRQQHGNVHLFASSIDYAHFSAARRELADPADQASIPHPRIGFYGVLDERLDCDLLQQVASLHPEWQFILIGPVVKIPEQRLPKAGNLHYLGLKDYSELPAYLANWDVAMLPFARNASTKFISPTKTPEYLAAGKPVVSTPICDVMTPYGEMGLVSIAADAQEFSAAIASSLGAATQDWLTKVDRFLEGNSWDRTFEGMWDEIQRCLPPSSRQALHDEMQIGREEHASV